MLLLCYNKISDKTVNNLFFNLTVVDIDWQNSYESLVNIDLSKYKSATSQINLSFSPEQETLFMKLDKVREEFITKQRSRQAEASKTISLFGIDFTQVSEEIKTYYLIGVFSFFFLILIILLCKLNKGNNEKSKKKDKKRN